MLRPTLRRPDYSWVVICILNFVMVVGCATKTKGVKSDEIHRSLDSLRAGVKYTLGEFIKNTSENNRTYFSEYHKVGTDLGASANKKKQRGQVVITLLGDRRPYSVLVLYRIEKRNGRKFIFDRYDKRLAEEYFSRYEEYLNSRPEDRDMIDDFRPY